MANSATDAAGPPEDFAALRERIVRRRDAMPKRLLQFADFALRHPQEVALGTIAELATLAGVQPSALVRFAQAFGYAGFSDLQAVFRLQARQRWPEYQERVAALRDGGPAARLAGFAEAASASLARLVQTVEASALIRAVDSLAAADTIHLIGARRSYPAVAYLAYALAMLGLRCHVIDQAGGLAGEQIDLMPATDALLAISFTPYAPVTLDIAARAARRGAAVVAITDTPFSPLVRSATVWLEVVEVEHGSFRSLSATIALGLTLAVSVAERRAGRP